MVRISASRPAPALPARYAKAQLGLARCSGSPDEPASQTAGSRRGFHLCRIAQAPGAQCLELRRIVPKRDDFLADWKRAHSQFPAAGPPRDSHRQTAANPALPTARAASPAAWSVPEYHGIRVAPSVLSLVKACRSRRRPPDWPSRPWGQ